MNGADFNARATDPSLLGGEEAWGNRAARSLGRSAGRLWRAAGATVLTLVALGLHSPRAAASGTGGDPCVGPGSLLVLLNRPTVADSVCVAQPGDLVFEGGYKNQLNDGTQSKRDVTYPNALLRYGLPGHWEFDLFPPSFGRQTYTPPGETSRRTITGSTDVTVGAKYQFNSFGPLLLAMDTKVTLPTGPRPFGRGETNAVVNGILAYSITQHLGVGAEFGVATMTTRNTGAGIRRRTTLNPDIVLKYHPITPLQLYAEVYGTTNSGSGRGMYALDGGVQYLVTPWWEVDAVVDTRLSGPRDTPAHYLGFGLGLRF